MALTRNITDRIEYLEHDGTSTTFEIRALSHHQLMTAIDKTFDDTARKMKSLDGVTLPEGSAEDRERQRAAALEPRNRYQRDKVLEAGIVSWSYQAELNEDTRNDLDETTALFLFDAIIALSIRTPAEKKESSANLPPTTAQDPDHGPSN